MIQRFLILITCCVSITACAQWHVSVEGGANQSRITIKDYYSENVSNYIGNDKTRSKNVARNAFFAGVKVDYDITSNLSLSSRVLIDNVGFTQHFEHHWGGDWEYDSLFGKDVVKLTYLSLPVYFTFYATPRNTKVYVGVGGFVRYGLFGTNDFKSTYSSIPWIRDSIMPITFNNNKNTKAAYHANRLDYGLSITAGIQLRNNLFLEGAYDGGLRSVFKDRYLVYQGRTLVYSFNNKVREFRIGIGYRFK